MERVQRYDASKLEKFERTPSGGLKIPATVTRTGVLVYHDEQGRVVRELRHPDDVFDAASVATLEDAIVTDMHPQGLVSPDTFKKDSVGHVRSPLPDRDAGVIRADLLVNDGEEIRKIESGERKDTSSGYSCVLDWTAGVFNGEQYDARQTQIRYNHVGIGPSGWGRAGPQVTLRLDGDKMKTHRIDGIDYEVGSAAHEQALARRDAAYDEMRGHLDGAREQIKKLEGDAVALKVKLDSATSADEVDRRVNARVVLLDSARAVLGKKYDSKGKTDNEVMLDALEKAGVKVPEKSSEAYVSGRFDAIVESASRTEGRADGDPPWKDEEDDDEDKDKKDKKDGGDGVRFRRGREGRRDGLQGLDAVRADSEEYSRTAHQKPLDLSKS